MRARRLQTLLLFLLAAPAALAQFPEQRIGKPLNLAGLQLQTIYANDFSGQAILSFESDLLVEGKRAGEPPDDSAWVVEGGGDAEVCGGTLQVAPVQFASCGVPDRNVEEAASHVVVWNRKRFPADMLLEFTVNHHGSDDGLTLVFIAAEGLNGESIFDGDLPPRLAEYRNYNRGELRNYTVSYWSRNKKPSLVKRGEQYTNRIRKNPGAQKLSTEYSRTDKCSDCDYRVRILKSGGLIAVEINGEVVNQAFDPEPLGGGYIGLRNMQGVDRVSYDNFKVSSVDTP